MFCFVTASFGNVSDIRFIRIIGTYRTVMRILKIFGVLCRDELKISFEGRGDPTFGLYRDQMDIFPNTHWGHAERPQCI